MSNMGLSLEDFEGDKKNYFESYKQKADALFEFIKNASIQIFHEKFSKKDNMEIISLDKNDYKTILEKKTKLLTNNVLNIKLKLQNIEEKEKFIKRNTFVIKNGHLHSKKQASKDFQKKEKIITKEKLQDISDISKFSSFDNHTMFPRERSQSTFFQTNNLDSNLKKIHPNSKKSSVNLPFLPSKNNDGKRRSVSFAEKPIFLNKIDSAGKESIFLTEKKNDYDSFQTKQPFTERRSILVNLNNSRKLSETEKIFELKSVIFLNTDKKSDLSINSSRKSVIFSNSGDKNSSLEGPNQYSIFPENRVFEVSKKNYNTTSRKSFSVIPREKNNKTSFLYDNIKENNQKDNIIRLESKIKEFDDLTQKAIKNEGKVKRAIRKNSYGKMGPVKDILVFDTK